jgi:hypothetical protein
MLGLATEILLPTSLELHLLLLIVAVHVGWLLLCFNFQAFQLGSKLIQTQMN